jgi:hypothetical protein
MPGRLAVGLLLGLPLVLFWPALFGGRMLWGPDIQTLQFAFASAARRALAQGELPHWIDGLLCGMPSIAGTNLLFWHPVELGLALLHVEPWRVFGIDSAIEVGAGGLGFYLLSRRLGLGRSSALLAALAFALSGTQISLLYPGHINNSKAVAMIPWAFWGVLCGWTETRWNGWAWAGVALALQILGLGLQVFAYTIIGLCAFAAWLPYSSIPGARADAKPWRPALLGLLLCGAVAFALAAPQLLPSLEYKAYSWREGFSYEQFTSWSFHPKEALGWIVPGFYGWREPTYHGDWPFCLTTEYFGLLPWFLAFAALAAAWVKESWRARLRRPEGFFLGLAVFSFLAGIGKHFPLHLLFYHLPVYNGFRTWTRFLNLLTFAVCVLGAFGWEALVRLEGEALARALRGARLFAALAVAAAFFALEAATGSVQAAAAALTQKVGPGGATQALQLAQATAYKAGFQGLLLLSASTAFLSLRARPRLLLALALGLLAWDASVVPRRFLQFQDPAAILAKPAVLDLLPDPQGLDPYRIWDPQGAWVKNTATVFGYEATQGYHGVQMAAPIKLQTALAQRQIDWLNVTNTRYVVSAAPLGVPPGWTDLAAGKAGVHLYRNPGAWPRARLMGRAVSVADDAEAFRLLGQPGYDLNVVPLKGAPALDAGPLEGGVRFTRRSTNRRSLEATASKPALLLLSQTWYPAWRATVDGAAAPVLSAYGGALTAVPVPAGTHSVELWYQPTVVYAGLGLALLGLAGLGVLLWLDRRRRREA